MRGSLPRKLRHSDASTDTSKLGRHLSSSHKDLLSCHAKTGASPQELNLESAIGPLCSTKTGRWPTPSLRERNKEEEWTPGSERRRDKLRGGAVHAVPTYPSSSINARGQGSSHGHTTTEQGSVAGSHWVGTPNTPVPAKNICYSLCDPESIHAVIDRQ
jgi:hypothetical protein